MRVPTGILVLIAILGVYAARGLFRNYLISMTSAKAPGCVELLDRTTRDEEGLTFIIGSIQNNCDRKVSNVTVVFKLDRTPGLGESLPEGIVYAYIRDVKPGEIRPFKSALPISRTSTFRFDRISAY